MIDYCMYDGLRALAVFTYECIVIFRMISLSKFLHKTIVFGLLRASFTKFYNLITTGRLMNRLSKDIYQIDLLIPSDINLLLNNFGNIVYSLILTMMICTISTIPIAIFYFFLSIFLAFYFMKAKR